MNVIALVHEGPLPIYLLKLLLTVVLLQLVCAEIPSTHRQMDGRVCFSLPFAAAAAVTVLRTDYSDTLKNSAIDTF